jgi:protein translocase SecG subunit
MAILSILLTVIIIATSILMILIVLVQRPKQEGLGAAFGGGTLDSALGAHTTDILQKITTYLGVIFFVSAIGLAMVKTREFNATAAQNPLENVENREPEIPGLPPSLSGHRERSHSTWVIHQRHRAPLQKLRHQRLTARASLQTKPSLPRSLRKGKLISQRKVKAKQRQSLLPKLQTRVPRRRIDSLSV